MPALFFPNPDAVRWVVANGIVPADVSDAPAQAGYDDHGRLWLEPLTPLPPHTLAALTRLGVQVVGEVGVPTEPVACWAELLPLRPSADLPTGTVLFELPPLLLPAFAAELRRLNRAPVGVRLLDSGEAWVTTPAPPASVVLRCCEPDSPVEPFTEHAPGVWVRAGYSHPLPHRLVIPAGHVWLLRPPRVLELCPSVVPVAAFEDYRLAPRRLTRQMSADAAPIPVRFSLARVNDTPREVLWVFAGERPDEFLAFCRDADERVLREFEVANVGYAEGRRILVRATPGKRVPPPLPLAAPGFCPDPRAPGLFVPAGCELRPVVRGKDVSRVFDLADGKLVWVEPHAGGVVPHAVPAAAFRPIGELVSYSAPECVRLEAEELPPDTFPFLLPVVVDDRPPVPLSADGPPTPLPVAAPVEVDDGPGWLARSLETFARRVRQALKSAAAVLTPAESEPAEKPTRAAPASPRGRVAQKLSSADALLHGHDRAARRHELESRLLDEFTRLGPDERASRWAELAAIYGATANPADAAICWVNAIWEVDPPPDAWLEQWFLAECRAARQTDPAATLDRWLSEPNRFGVGRVVAAYSAWAAHQPHPPIDLLVNLPRVLAFLDQHFDDLPARAAWVTRLALTKLCDGDALGLARWRDRVVHRIRDRGPGLDLDEPSFLRFHGTASADRFQTARAWLSQAKGLILDWIKDLDKIGNLGWTGITDPHTGVAGREQNVRQLQATGLAVEKECTAAYAQLMLAWGLACLGERTLSRDWAAFARKTLVRAGGGDAEPSAHAVLADAFQHRIRDAQEGRAPRPGLPPELAARLDALPELQRHAVDRLREHARILEPVERVRAFRGRDLREFWGYDQLGELLYKFFNRSDPEHLNDEARMYLAACGDEPSSTTVPRVVFTLLEVAPLLDAAVVSKVLANVLPAVEWLEAWLQATRYTDAERARHLPKFRGRVLEAAFAAAAWFDQWDAARPLVSHLVRRVTAGDTGLRAAVGSAAAPLFRSLGKLGFRSEAAALLRAVDAGRTDASFPVARLGLAVGWFAVGNEDAGNRALNDARDTLFLTKNDDAHEPTELAIAYAEALGHAPPRIALGRLEEIFQRLDRIKVSGSTNLYFTLKPLQLIDAVVRSVVSEDFALGPAVRGWLDDDEFLIRRRIHRDMAAVLAAEGL